MKKRKSLVVKYNYPQKVGQGKVTYWPEGEPMPTVYKPRPEPLPCPSCRAIYLGDGGQASAYVGKAGEVVWLRCRSCEYRWKTILQKES